MALAPFLCNPLFCTFPRDWPSYNLTRVNWFILVKKLWVSTNSKWKEWPSHLAEDSWTKRKRRERCGEAGTDMPWCSQPRRGWTFSSCPGISRSCFWLDRHRLMSLFQRWSASPSTSSKGKDIWVHAHRKCIMYALTSALAVSNSCCNKSPQIGGLNRNFFL